MKKSELSTRRGSEPKGSRTSDVIVATAAETAPLVAEVSKKSGAPGVYFIQHLETWTGRSFVESTWRLPLYKIAISDWLVEHARERGLSVIHVPNSIDAGEFPQGPRVSQRSIDVLAMVSDKPFKRADLICDVLRRLSDQRPDFVGVTFGTCERPEGLPQSIKHVMLPAKRLLSSLYADSRVYLCASDMEGWHLPPAEAMSAGAAVVSTDIPGVTTYAKNVAKFAPVGDALALVQEVDSLLSDPGECQRYASLGQARIAEYTPGRAGENFAQALAAVMNKHKGRS